MASQIEEVGLRLRADGVVETSRGVDVAAASVGRLGREAAAASPPMERLGATSRQTTQAMRQLPMQITDIFTSLASGMPVGMVAIQQGGQIRDSFGGIVPAGQAMLGMLNPLNLALGGTALALGAVALAYKQGSSEQDAMARSLILTGNAAGTTLDQMVAMAQGIDAVVGTQAQATEGLAQMAGTGLVAGANLQKFTELAIRMERAVGTPVENTVKVFAELGRAPVEASVKLNETTNYLTRAVYDQIVALEKQGKQAEAASLAQNAYADAMRTRADELDTRLGLIERAWRGITDAAKESWDAMLGIGRQKTLTEQLADAEKQLAAMPEARRGSNPLQAEQRRAAMRARIEDLRQQVYMEGEAAAAQAANAEQTRRAIAASEDARRRSQGTQPKRDPREEAGWSAYSSWRTAGMEEVAFEAEQERRAAEARAKARERDAQLAERNADAIRREADALANQTAEIGLNEQQLLARRQAQVDAQIAEAAALLSVLEGAEGYERQTEALRRQIAELQRLREVQGQAAAAKAGAAQRQADEEANRRRAEGIAQSIEDGLMNGFRNGKSLADIFLAELKAQFARTVLRPMIDPLVKGAFGGGGGGAGGIFGSLLSLFGGGNPLAGATGFGDANMLALLSEVRHGGGLAGREPAAAMRMLPASTFRHAPRFHTGIGPDELPAVLKRNEGVFTEGQMRAMAPVSELAKAAGPRITYAPTVHIDSRTDRAEVAALVQVQLKRSQAELLEMMERGMV